MSPISVETGPMFSGKTEELVGAIKRRKIGGQVQGRDFLVFNSFKDTRYGENEIGSHNGEKILAISLKNSGELLRALFDLPEEGVELGLEHVKPELEKLRAVYLDEGQFFDQNLGEVLSLINDVFIKRDGGVPSLEIRVAGLDMDFRGKPFGPVPDVMARAEKVTKHVAVCAICGENNATMSQRLVDGKPVSYDDPLIVVGAREDYTARCPVDYEPPGKPRISLKNLGV